MPASLLQINQIKGLEDEILNLNNRILVLEEQQKKWIEGVVVTGGLVKTESSNFITIDASILEFQLRTLNDKIDCLIMPKKVAHERFEKEDIYYMLLESEWKTISFEAYTKIWQKGSSLGNWTFEDKGNPQIHTFTPYSYNTSAC